MLEAQGLDHIAFQVHDLDRSIQWYQTVLNLRERERYTDQTGRGEPTVLCSGNGCVALFPAAADAQVQPLSGHIAFRLDRLNFEQTRAELDRQGINYKFVEYAKVHSLYLNDPDGYEIELSTWEL